MRYRLPGPDLRACDQNSTHARPARPAAFVERTWRRRQPIRLELIASRLLDTCRGACDNLGFGPLLSRPRPLLGACASKPIEPYGARRPVRTSRQSRQRFSDIGPAFAAHCPEAWIRAARQQRGRIALAAGADHSARHSIDVQTTWFNDAAGRIPTAAGRRFRGVRVRCWSTISTRC